MNETSQGTPESDGCCGKECPMCGPICSGGAHYLALMEDGIDTREKYLSLKKAQSTELSSRPTLNYLVQSQGVPEPAGYYDESPAAPELAKPLLCVYHSPCLDGFTAAWAVWLKHPDAEFVAGVYGQDPPDCTGRNVVLVDFSYKRAVMASIINVARSVLVLDHHKTAMADLSGLDTTDIEGPIPVKVIFDMTKSGARLAWEHFHPSVEVPLLVKLVEDRDLWRFALPASKALNAVFFSYDYDFQEWNTLASELHSPDGYDGLLAAGQAIERKHMKDVKELVEKLRHVRKFKRIWDKYPLFIPCANLPYTYASDAANLMAQDAPFAATYYQDADGDFVFSLRSIEGGADVSEIVKQYGGGGHKNAAGFRVKSLEEL